MRFGKHCFTNTNGGKVNFYRYENVQCIENLCITLKDSPHNWFYLNNKEEKEELIRRILCLESCSVETLI